MTRQKWTTKEQEEWLEERKPAFLIANQSKAAAKEFFPEVVKEFREKWPVAPVNDAEIKDAGTREFAMKVKRDKYDRRTCSWFHNNTRTATSSAGAHGVLVIKAPAQPRKLQPWQAYQALTYENRWKRQIDKEYGAYEREWAENHPNKKPPTSRFEYMNNFIKKKYEEADADMKKTCEKYRMPETRSEVSPAMVKPQSTVNADYQRAINKLPRTLANIGDSLMKQTGWNVTIIVGGPVPSSNGTIMSYISNVGKTKNGDSYKEFLGSKDYDEHIHRPFDNFLHACFTPDDCAERSLIKADDEVLTKETAESGGVMDSEDNTTISPHVEESEYEKAKAQNIEELQAMLAKLKENYPVPEDMKTKEARLKTKAPQSKKREPPHNNSTVSYGESSVTVPLVTTTSSSSANITANDDGATYLAQTPSSGRLLASTGPQETTLVPQSPQKPVASIFQQVIDNTPLSNAHPIPQERVEPTISGSLIISGQNPSVSITPVITHIELAQSNSSTPPDSGSAIPDIAGAVTDIEMVQENTVEASTQDVDKIDVPPHRHQNDDNLPAWLVPMITFIRQASENSTWQALVTEFAEFERGGPPCGNLPTKLRPKEVSVWAKNKKRDTVPRIDPHTYGPRFIAWWCQLQPSWRKVGKDVTLPLIHDTPDNETWQASRKGGKAGIYVVIMGLSWWVRAQHVENSIDMWMVVDDVLWVLQQMNEGEMNEDEVATKRVHEGEEGEEDRPRKSRRLSK